MLLAENRVSESRGTKKDYEPVWVAAAKSGFVLAFEELVNRHEANILRLALCSTQNKEDAEDVLRETFLKAYEHLHEFRGDSRFSTWLVRIAVSESLLKLRKRRPNVLSLDEATETEDDFVQGDVENWGPAPEQRYAEGELQRIASEELSELKTDMTAESISDVVEQAVEWTGMKNVPVEDRSRLVSDNGPGYLAHAFEDYLRMLQIRHIRCSPHHPQTNGKLERFHETLKARVNLLVYSSPEELRRAIGEFIKFYNHLRYHEGIGNVAPADVYYGRREAILKRREEQKHGTLEERFRYNRSRSREITMGALSSKS